MQNFCMHKCIIVHVFILQFAVIIFIKQSSTKRLNIVNEYSSGIISIPFIRSTPVDLVDLFCKRHNSTPDKHTSKHYTSLGTEG